MPTNTNRFNIKEVCSSAWRKVKGSKGAMFPYVLIFFLYSRVSILDKLAAEGDLNFNFHLSSSILVILAILTVLSSIGSLYLGVQRANDIPIKAGIISRVLKPLVFWRLLKVTVWSFLIVAPGILLILLPSIKIAIPDVFIPMARLIEATSVVIGFFWLLYISLRLGFVYHVVFMKDVNSWEAIKLTWQGTKSNVLRILCLLIFLFVITLFFNLITFGVASFWTLPFMDIALGEAYKRLIPSNNSTAHAI